MTSIVIIIIIIIVVIVRVFYKKHNKIESGLVYRQRPIYTHAKEPNFIGDFNNSHNIIHNIKGRIFCIFKSNDLCDTRDTFIALLNKSGKINCVDNLMFYNTSTKTAWEFRGGSNQVPSHPKYKIFGPMCGDDNARLRHLWIYDNFDCCYIDLDTLDSDITEIRFFHFVYEYEMQTNKNITSEDFQFIIFNEWPPSPLDYNFNYQQILDNQLNNIVVSDGTDENISQCPNFVSASLIRNKDNSWDYIPCWEKLDSLVDYIALIDQ